MKQEKEIKLCKIRLIYAVDYYAAANDNKTETAVATAERYTTMKLEKVLGDTFQFENAEVVSEKKYIVEYEIKENNKY